MEVITNKKSANSKFQAGETRKWQPRVFPTSYGQIRPQAIYKKKANIY